jgi:hypothetical protein
MHAQDRLTAASRRRCRRRLRRRHQLWGHAGAGSHLIVNLSAGSHPKGTQPPGGSMPLPAQPPPRPSLRRHVRI